MPWMVPGIIMAFKLNPSRWHLPVVAKKLFFGGGDYANLILTLKVVLSAEKKAMLA